MPPRRAGGQPLHPIYPLASAPRQLNDLSDDMAMKLSILFCTDAREALIKTLAE